MNSSHTHNLGSNVPAGSIEMPRYRSHKTVWALKIATVTRVGESTDTSESPIVDLTFTDPRYAPMSHVSTRDKPCPEAGWYFVRYADGYYSFSPAKQFEDGNTLEIDPNGVIGIRNNQSFHADDLANWFSYHAPNAEQLIQYGAIRTAARAFADCINLHVPGGADKSAAMRLVREAMMTANAGIACHRGRPTIEQLEKILAKEDDTPVTIQPDGSITVE